MTTATAETKDISITLDDVVATGERIIVIENEALAKEIAKASTDDMEGIIPKVTVTVKVEWK
ncbi:hypothetical protein [Pseudovibrio sp. Tun.PSC04-5.I4]|uniref:hypothetical protein n=1 Tax=Pseudovibrio sp. Tun.PSC04-5.I4 TaxID=1798213 RepID=UPI0008876642|nr:hypothetical protein [Pseudovibrio sp. Tun.PSC04-5.I4]SDQ13253.1 hypothetical protein SAMN04515695_0085 [Pseudovibrio sp. Tun.PSC04-5.I4]